MNTDRPNIDFEAHLAGTGTIARANKQIPINRWTLERLKYASNSPWEFSCEVPSEESENLEGIVADSASPLTFSGETDKGERIDIADVRWRHQSGSTLTGHVYSFDLELTKFDPPPTSQKVNVFLTDTPLARQRHSTRIPHFDGTVECHDEIPPISWAFDLGAGALYRGFSHERASVGGSESVVQVGQPLLAIQVKEEAIKVDPISVISGCSSELTEALRLLSFLSRQHVAWTRIQLVSYRTSQNGKVERVKGAPSRYQVARASARPESFYPLVHPGRLPEDGLSRLHQQLRSLSCREAILYTMAYLVQAPQEETGEGGLAMAFTGMEALVNAIGELDGSSYLLTHKEFNPFAACLRKAIRDYGADQGWGQLRHQSMYRKLAELRRASISPRVARLVEKYDVQWRDLWPEGTTLESAIQLEYAIRNDLIHRGTIAAPNRAYAAYLRIHALTERLVFALLAGSSAWLDTFAYRHCALLCQGDSWPELR